jgi:ribosome biogenesis GTP-binding protein YsxC/EngB
MKISSAVFVCSSPNSKLIPKHNFPEYAFIGRSNVGKSSLINMLTGQKSLAHTSAKPGKTQLINHFLLNNEWYLVDLPGYGYAKASKSKREVLGKIIADYLKNAPQMALLFVLIDIRLEPQAIDLAFIEELGMMGIPFSIVFTKADKLSPTAAERQVSAYKEKLLEQWESLPPLFISSAETKQGREALLDYIQEINNSL